METVERLGRCTLIQDGHCFRLGGDSVALGGFATVRRGWRVCDLGCGSGALGLLLLERAAALTLTGVELDPVAAALAGRNFAANGVTGRVVTGDLRDAALLPAGQWDLAVSNPPWFAQGRGVSGGGARCEEGCTLAELCTAAARLLRNGGRFALVHRPERLVEVFAALRVCGLEPKRLRLAQHTLSAPPSAALIEAVRQGKPGLEVLPVLLLGSGGRG